MITSFLMMSRLRDVIILGVNFLFSFQKLVLRMVHAKNYETMSKFVEVMLKKLWPVFFQTWCIMYYAVHLRYC